MIMKDLSELLEFDFFTNIIIPKSICLFFKPSREISKKEYLTKYLTPSDAMHLQLFLGNFSYKSKTNIAILAVGSSTFPKSYWKKREKINEKDSTVGISEAYRGIDLFVMPKYKIEHKKFEENIKNSLDYWGLEPFNLKKIVSEMEWYKRNDGKYLPFTTYNEENKGFSISLPNKTKLNIIFNKENYFKIASEKIKKERKNKNPFCIIYGNE